jgi:hypothetical protein
VNFYRESLFQIMPISNFEIHDELSNPKNLKYFSPHLDLPTVTLSRRRPREKSKAFTAISTSSSAKTYSMEQKPSSGTLNPTAICVVSREQQILGKGPS